MEVGHQTQQSIIAFEFQDVSVNQVNQERKTKTLTTAVQRCGVKNVMLLLLLIQTKQ